MTQKLLIRLVDAEYAISKAQHRNAAAGLAAGSRFLGRLKFARGDDACLPCGAHSLNVQSSGGWRCFRIEQHFNFDVPGILASVLNPLSEAGVGIFANSTFSTDYIFIIGSDLDKAVAALKAHGHELTN